MKKDSFNNSCIAAMDNRTRFLNVMAFKPVDEVPNYEVGVWPQTAERWRQTGMPAHALGGATPKTAANKVKDECFSADFLFVDKDVPFFKLDHIEFTRIDTYIPSPPFEEAVFEENEQMIVFRDSCGITHKALKTGAASNIRMSMDQYIDFPVKDRAGFLDMKRRYSPDDARYPSNWNAQCTQWLNRTDPLCLLYIGEFGYYSLLRRWMGTEGASYIFYDDPALVEEMFEFMTEYILRLIAKALRDATYDCFHIFEDMAFNSGPLVSPDMVRKFILPQYKRLIAHLRQHGITQVMFDCDGNINSLIPLWIEAGITCLYPIEVRAGSDPVAIRKKYGRDIAMVGGMSKYLLELSDSDMASAIERQLGYLLPLGGYIPTLDHLVPPHIPYEKFLRYLEVKARCLKGQSGA